MADTPSSPVMLEIDENLCTGSGMCRQIAPQLFDLPADSAIAVVLEPSVTDPELISLAEEAEEACPTMAVLLRRG